MKRSAALTKPVPREKPASRNDKYFLRDLHQEIDFYDRKLAYLDQFGEFATAAERELAEKGLRAKRAPLEKAALELRASGVEFEEKDLPRSFRSMNQEPDSAPRTLSLVKKSKRPAAATQPAADR
ncbi:hypothetical protein [Occallatibacter riparius]|uniref:Uncharacterized protein n=1 Tax=Occallatibacter riparius TaxID=1002689 RepID=A0A9J7BNF2_9BACT|nr:hypothetical protein [Occallatibacter riparius]UWZ83282.1 hypothetical protein MOP44_22265 [Occallatibacter riparius]